MIKGSYLPAKPLQLLTCFYEVKPAQTQNLHSFLPVL